MTDSDAPVASRPPRVVQLTARALDGGSDYPPRQDDHTVHEVKISAIFDRPVPKEEWSWWVRQLRPTIGRGPVSGAGGAPGSDVGGICFGVRPDEVEAGARRFLDAFDAIAAGYPANFDAWWRERCEERAADERRRADAGTPYQAILDAVLAKRLRQPGAIATIGAESLTPAREPRSGASSAQRSPRPSTSQ